MTQPVVWLVYDGKCPICSPAANALQIKKAVGELKLVDARNSSDPLLGELTAAGLNLDEGMVVKMSDRLYHGADAMHLLALIGTGSDCFNRLNVLLFRNATLARLSYPVFRFVRNGLLRVKGVQKINNLHG